MDRENLIERLRDLDENAQIITGVPPIKHPVVIVGGAAFLLSGLTSRNTTYDIDVFMADRAIKAIFEEDPNLNFRCSAYMESIPHNYEDRLQRLPIATKVIEYYAPCSEDLAIMKLFRWEDRDVQDLTNPTFLEKLDWNLLNRLAHDPNEVYASRITEPDKDRGLAVFFANYEQYRKDYCK
ncbi:MAG: DUF6036 family nucleotidyltransferase [Eggerthellaceae bacterium]|nr:DUF6036 family nucleotidyltransferase [Eggerthellaceae bacterium]